MNNFFKTQLQSALLTYKKNIKLVNRIIASMKNVWMEYVLCFNLLFYFI